MTDASFSSPLLSSSLPSHSYLYSLNSHWDVTRYQERALAILAREREREVNDHINFKKVDKKKKKRKFNNDPRVTFVHDSSATFENEILAPN